MLVTIVTSDQIEVYLSFYRNRNISLSIVKMIEDIATLDTMLADSFPKEINKAKIREIFEILQTQERSD